MVSTVSVSVKILVLPTYGYVMHTSLYNKIRITSIAMSVCTTVVKVMHCLVSVYILLLLLLLLLSLLSFSLLYLQLSLY